MKLLLGLFSTAFLLAIYLYITPVLKPFPILSGPYPVGIETLELTDNNRKETFSANNEDTRKLVLHIWYPAENINNFQRENYLGKKMPFLQKYFSEHYNLPDWVSKKLLSGISTNAYINAPLAKSEKSWPIILFSHGLLGLPSDMYTVFTQELASQGYIVIGIDHSYFNTLTLYSNGKIISSNNLNPKFEKLSLKDQIDFQRKAIEIYKQDIKFIIDQLVNINKDKNSKFYQHLNLDKIVIMGHSAGGTAAIETCRIDNRCKAAVDLDGWYDHIIGDDPLQVPLLLVFAEDSLKVEEPTAQYLKRKELTREQYFERERKITEHRNKLCSKNCSTVIIPKITHKDFGDTILTKWPLHKWHTLDPYISIALINDTIKDFLNKNLK